MLTRNVIEPPLLSVSQVISQHGLDAIEYMLPGYDTFNKQTTDRHAVNRTTCIIFVGMTVPLNTFAKKVSSQVKKMLRHQLILSSQIIRCSSMDPTWIHFTQHTTYHAARTWFCFSLVWLYMYLYSDVIMVTKASQGADQRKHQSSASLAFVRGIHRWPVNSPHKGPVTWKMFPFDDVFMISVSGKIICCIYPYPSRLSLPSGQWYIKEITWGSRMLASVLQK